MIQWVATKILLAELILILNYYIVVMIHETGHMLAGLISGYRFSCIRIGKKALVHTNHGLRMKKLWGKQSGGQCIMYAGKSALSPTVMILGGITANLLFAFLFLSFIFIVKRNELRVVFGFSACLHMVSVIVNLLPLNRMIATDGECLRESRTDIEISVYHNQLLIAKYLIEGYSYAEMPEELFECNYKESQMSGIVYEHALYRYYRRVEMNQLDEAEGLLDYLMNNNCHMPRWLLEETERDYMFFSQLKNKRMINNQSCRIQTPGDLKVYLFCMTPSELEKYIDLFKNYVYPGELRFVQTIYDTLYTRRLEKEGDV